MPTKMMKWVHIAMWTPDPSSSPECGHVTKNTIAYIAASLLLCAILIAHELTKLVVTAE
jgi:hypothetical protein